MYDTIIIQLQTWASSFLGVVQPEELVGKLSISYLADCVNICIILGSWTISVQLPIFTLDITTF